MSTTVNYVSVMTGDHRSLSCLVCITFHLHHRSGREEKQLKQEFREARFTILGRHGTPDRDFKQLAQELAETRVGYMKLSFSDELVRPLPFVAGTDNQGKGLPSKRHVVDQVIRDINYLTLYFIEEHTLPLQTSFQQFVADVLTRLPEWHLQEQLEMMGNRTMSPKVPLVLDPRVYQDQYADFRAWVESVLKARGQQLEGLRMYTPNQADNWEQRLVQLHSSWTDRAVSLLCTGFDLPICSHWPYPLVPAHLLRQRSGVGFATIEPQEQAFLLRPRAGKNKSLPRGTPTTEAFADRRAQWVKAVLNQASQGGPPDRGAILANLRRRWEGSTPIPSLLDFGPAGDGRPSRPLLQQRLDQVRPARSKSRKRTRSDPPREPSPDRLAGRLITTMEDLNKRIAQLERAKLEKQVVRTAEAEARLPRKASVHSRLGPVKTGGDRPRGRDPTPRPSPSAAAGRAQGPEGVDDNRGADLRRTQSAMVGLG